MNTPLANAEFRLQWNQTNFLWLIGEEPQDEKKIERCRQLIEDTQQEIEKLKRNAP